MNRLSRRTSRGSSLIEVLIGVLVMSVALLALAAMQTRQLTSSNGSKLRQMATSQAYAMADTMRTNRRAVAAGAFNNPTAVVTATCMTATGCTPQEMANMSYASWSDTLSAQLPSGAGVVCVDSTPDDGEPGAEDCDGIGALYAVKVWWVDAKLNPGVNQRFVTAVMP